MSSLIEVVSAFLLQVVRAEVLAQGAARSLAASLAAEGGREGKVAVSLPRIVEMTIDLPFALGAEAGPASGRDVALPAEGPVPLEVLVTAAELASVPPERIGTVQLKVQLAAPD